MNHSQKWLLILNVVGGLFVIGSYVYGFKTQPGAGEKLWGGVPTTLRPWYGVSMLLSAVGYFCFLFYLLFRIVPQQVNLSFGYGIFFLIFFLILFPSALWMSLTFRYLAQPAIITWCLVRAVLLIVGIASTILVIALYALRPVPATISWILAFIGAMVFAFHTLVLDGVIWPVLFRK